MDFIVSKTSEKFFYLNRWKTPSAITWRIFMKLYSINEETLQDIINIKTGLFYPLTGFMDSREYQSVLDYYTLPSGEIFTLPITFDVPKELYHTLNIGEIIQLEYQSKIVATLLVSDKFLTDTQDCKKIFLTLDTIHPGVQKEINRSPYRIGGKIEIIEKNILKNALKPSETKKIFTEMGWSKVVGFQTRNPIHKAHEYLQRIGLEICDGIFINPIIGWKKNGDFTQEAVMAAYHTMIDLFYPKDRVYIAGLKTQMRYAGPREAIFHAIIRRNLGCTHFIIGRDHAGVGGYYTPYAAHELAKSLRQKQSLGIELLLLREPYYCKKCGQIVTDRTCSHYETDRVEISGSIIRNYIKTGYIPDELFMRKEIFSAILQCQHIFIE